MQRDILQKQSSNFIYKDIIRIVCGLLLMVKSLLLIIEDKYHIFFNASTTSFFENVVNLLFAAIYLIAALVMLFGIDLRKYLMYIVTILFINIIFTFQNVAINHDLALTFIIAFFTLTIYIVGEGNMTIDGLKSNQEI